MKPNYRVVVPALLSYTVSSPSYSFVFIAFQLYLSPPSPSFINSINFTVAKTSTFLASYVRCGAYCLSSATGKPWWHLPLTTHPVIVVYIEMTSL